MYLGLYSKIFWASRCLVENEQLKIYEGTHHPPFNFHRIHNHFPFFVGDLNIIFSGNLPM